jgi:hypothetical protein
MSFSQPRFLVCALGVLCTAAPAAAQSKKRQPPVTIEGLAPPKAARPPRLQEDEEGEEHTAREAETERQLEKKRKRRQKQRDRDRDGKVDEAAKRKASLLEEALRPRERAFLLELALVGGSALTDGQRSGYSLDPNVHVNAFYRLGSERTSDQITPWIGFRIAPFTGTGYFKGRPGRYGLTYFGPMIGLGRIAPVSEDTGTGDRPATGTAGDRELPVVTGFAATFGISAVASLGKREAEATGKEPADDFQTRGVKFDAPGAWAELRYFRIHFGATSADFLLGLQSGQSKAWIYGGIGFGGWH